MAVALDQAEMRPDGIALDEAEGRPDRVEVRLEGFRLLCAVLVLGLGFVATIAWIATLGWLAAQAVRLIL
jgi:hypothetical protein